MVVAFVNDKLLAGIYGIQGTSKPIKSQVIILRVFSLFLNAFMETLA